MSHTRRCTDPVVLTIRAPLKQKPVAAGVDVDAKMSFAANQTVCVSPMGVGALRQGEITLRQVGGEDLRFAFIAPITRIVPFSEGNTILVSSSDGARVWTEQSDGDGGNDPP